MTLPPPPPPRRNGFRAFLRALGRGINMLRLVIINLVFFGVLFVLLLLLTAGVAGSRMERAVQDDSVLVIRPQGQLVEQYSIDPMQRTLARLSGEDPKQVQLRDLVGAIDAAATDPRITRILLLPDGLQGGGFAALREVGAALDRFRAAGKPVIAWAVNLDQGQYYLAAHADRLLVDPQGGVMLTGLANYRLFYKDLLDKLGVDVHLFRVGEFKSAAELKEIYLSGANLSPDREVIAYCRIGERSSHTWFVLKYLLGFNNVRNYDGSWTEWGNSVRVPIEK